MAFDFSRFEMIGVDHNLNEFSQKVHDTTIDCAWFFGIPHKNIKELYILVETSTYPYFSFTVELDLKHNIVRNKLLTASRECVDKIRNFYCYNSLIQDYAVEFCVAHEMWHYNQFIQKRMIVKDKHLFWVETAQDTIVEREKTYFYTDYINLPWEKKANTKALEYLSKKVGK